MLSAGLQDCPILLQSNPDVQEWMRSNGVDSLSQLEGYFEERVLELAALAGRSYIVWQVSSAIATLLVAHHWTSPSEHNH